MVADNRGVVITTLGWILIGIGAWLVVATLVGMLIGRAIRLRDRQVADDVGPGADPDVDRGMDPGVDPGVGAEVGADRGAQAPRRPEIPKQNSGGRRADPDHRPGH
ncbi:MAG TPA: hypothetical protein VEZ42_07845 [Pseudonocardia sp.]|nr:hypothetical protein [Pseudonocardia sp.]